MLKRYVQCCMTLMRAFELAIPETLIHQNVKDLYWLCYAPNIMQGPAHCEFSVPDLCWFLDLQAQPSHLEAHLDARNMFLLGSYFEALWEFLLAHNPATTLLAKNVQVFTGTLRHKKTLGEMDFIYFCKARQITVHLEVAVKFYIAYDSPHRDNTTSLPQHNWLGPQCNDRLDIKFHKLTHKQSCLSLTEEGQQALAGLGLQVDYAEISMPGFLFSSPQQPLIPDGANPQHLRGYHLGFSAFKQSSIEIALWQVVAKPYWLSINNSISHGQAQDSESYFDDAALLQYLQSHFENSDRAVMLAGFKASTAGVFNLQTRMFITADNWPKRTAITEHLLV